MKSGFELQEEMCFPTLRDFSLLSCRSWRFFMPLAKASHRQKAAVALYLVGSPNLCSLHDFFPHSL
jgi:hypothetical protein